MRARRAASGFTLVELLTVVAIVGVLAAIAVILVARHFRASRSLEALSIIQSIRTAQEARRAETGTYLNVSVSQTWYPAAPDGKKKRSWVMDPTSHPDAARWQQLGVSRPDGTQFGFKSWAGAPGPMTVSLGTEQPVALPTADDNWYVIEAAGDLNESTPKLSMYVATSRNGELYIENEGN